MATDGPPFAVRPEVIEALATLWRAGHAAYLVGGGVRDALLGLPVHDWDITTDARPERIVRVFPGASYMNRFGTVQAGDLEITTFRRDHRYADHRRPDNITFSQDIFEDLARRDLTINAIAWGRRGPDAAARIVDPADGQGDLRARLVRAVGDPARRFDEDALRLLRAVRIAARLEFSIEPMTRAAMMAHAADIEFVSEERLGDEIRRMLDSAEPSRAMRLMRETGVLAAVLPELDALATRGAPFDATMRTLDAAAATPGHELLAWSALLGELGPQIAVRIIERLRLAGRVGDAVAALVTAAPTPYLPAWTDADVRRYMRRVPAELLDDLLALRWARAETPDRQQLETELRRRVAAERSAKAPLSLAELAVDGSDLRETLGLPEGRTIGRILARLLADVIEDPALNTRLTLLTRASLILDEIMQADPGPAGKTSIG